MTIEQALKILDLKKDEINLDSIKKQYRKQSLKYHPDSAKTEDSSMFILVNSAYEYLISKIESNEGIINEDIFELNTRIENIQKAFQFIIDEFDSFYTNLCKQSVDNLANRINSKSSKSDLNKSIDSEFKKIVKFFSDSIISWFNTKINGVIDSYDDIFLKFFKYKNKQKKRNEYKHFYLSLPFYFIILIMSLLLWFDKLNILSFSLCLVGFFFLIELKYLDKKFWRLKKNDFKISRDFMILKGKSTKEDDELNAKFGGFGALLGVFGGPIGVIAGGLIGSMLGSFFGKSLEELKQELYKECLERFDVINKSILENLENKISQIEYHLIETIKENHSKNKKKAVEMILLDYKM